MSRLIPGRDRSLPESGDLLTFRGAVAAALNRTPPMEVCTTAAGRADLHRTHRAPHGPSPSLQPAVERDRLDEPVPDEAVSREPAGPGRPVAAPPSPLSAPAAAAPPAARSNPTAAVVPAAPADPAGDADPGCPTAPTGPRPGRSAHHGHLCDVAGALWAQHLRAPSRRTRDRLAVHYSPLVRAVAHRTAVRLPVHVEPADLVQAGVFGLLDAIERFDPGLCPRFESYAVPRIRGAVLDELRAQDWVPRTVRLRAREAERTRADLAVCLGRTASEREVADALRVPPRELRAATPQQLVSMELLAEGAGGMLDAFADDDPDPAAALQDRETRRQLWRAVAQLGERDRLVVRLYYLENRTLAETGRMLGVTESRVCQLHARIVGRLRSRLEELAAG